jgi:hypothetical protein
MPVLTRSSVRGPGPIGRGRRAYGVRSYIFQYLRHELGECRVFPAAQEREGVRLDERGPVGGGGVQRVEEVVLDSEGAWMLGPGGDGWGK